MPSAPKMRDTCASSRGDPTRIAPCRSALTRSMLPRRSASAPSRANTRWFTSWATSTRVAYAGTSTPYKLESREAKRVRSCVLVTVVGAPIDVTLPSDGEVHTLGERQFAGVVDRVGGSPHVGAPGVGPGLAAAAGVLLSPKAPPISAPDVPMLTLTMPQSEPSADMNLSASPWSDVNRLEDNPCGTALLSATASSKSSYGST